MNISIDYDAENAAPFIKEFAENQKQAAAIVPSVHLNR
jgi:hypothetical protein